MPDTTSAGEPSVPVNRRHEPRLKVPATYTLVRVRLPGDEHYRWSGHIYDVSLDGMRFELDESLDPGTLIEVRGMLPGHRHTLFRAVGRVVRLHDDHADLPPVRMAMRFEAFATSVDHYRLSSYLAAAGLGREAVHPKPMPRVQRPAA